ncbi:MAG TPA: HAMP domain-containing histidine kinase [Candidatus Blautia excrementipullorum]|nr:HAMP domain-containing histidine kinase [Candidatus Blautia excrementipullorum]
MRKKISESIRAKTFLSMLALLVICCVIIYAVVLVFLPKNYHARLEDQVTGDFYELAEKLKEKGWEACSGDLLEFSMRNNASVRIQDENEKDLFSVNFADTEEGTDSPGTSFSLSFSAEFRQGGGIFRLFAMVSLVAVFQSYEILLRLLPFIAVIILLISVAGALLCSHYYSGPLLHICHVADRMAGLDLNWKCEVKRKDEIGVLAESLNTMSRQLGNALDSLKSANEELQKDIAKEREQERQRIDFFTSVSHELKTPVAVLKGELEGMICRVGEYRDRDTYLRHCLKTVNDMEGLVKEILMAARMGGSDFLPAFSDLDLSRMLARSCREIKGRMEDRGMELHTDIEPDFHYQGDGRLLDKVFSNVLGNAVSYSPEGAAVAVSLQNGVFQVENTGVHIEEEDLKRIFMPFYRVEKSRSRNTGGSGLGLYITKMILEHHGVACTMENTENGVRFTAVFQV